MGIWSEPRRLAWIAAWAALAVGDAVAQEPSVADVQAAWLLKLLEHIPLATPVEPPAPIKPPPTPAPGVEPAPPKPVPDAKDGGPEPVGIGLLGTDDTARTARKVLVGKTLARAPVRLFDLQWNDVVKGAGLCRCRLLYVADELDEHELAALLRASRRAAVILVSCQPGFVAAGGDVQLFVLKDRVRFELNAESLKAKGLRPSPKILEISRKGPVR